MLAACEGPGDERVTDELLDAVPSWLPDVAYAPLCELEEMLENGEA
jgi:hypothetical protein